MAHMVKVAEIDELPPGKGKRILLEGREVTVYNREGRYVATATWPRHADGIVETTCFDHPGYHFDVGIADSPDRLQIDELHYQVHTDHTGVFVLIEEGVARPGREPRRQRRRA